MATPRKHGPRRRPRTELPHDPDPHGLVGRMRAFLRDQAMLNFAPRTVEKREEGLALFVRWCHERDLTQCEEMTRPLLERYRRWVFAYRKKNGKPLAFSTQANHLSALRVFFKWVARKQILDRNPACELELPRVQRGLPAVVFSAQEAEQVIAVPNPKEAAGLRDRAILELLYATGMRRMELCLLKLYDIDRTRELIHIRKGKGDKPRVVPLSERALAWVERYLDESRSRLLRNPADESLFIGERSGIGITPGYLTHLVSNYVRAANMGKKGSCHAFRHTMATLMLENGADIRHVQEMLGHANIQTTQIYTQVTLRKLREVYARTHPSMLPLRPEEDEDEVLDRKARETYLRTLVKDDGTEGAESKGESE